MTWAEDNLKRFQYDKIKRIKEPDRSDYGMAEQRHEMERQKLMFELQMRQRGLDLQQVQAGVLGNISRQAVLYE